MSGIEIVAGVAAIVTAFNGSVKLYRSWREKQRERLEPKENQNLERSLTIGGTTVQREYDCHFAKLGPELLLAMVSSPFILETRKECVLIFVTRSSEG